VIDPISTRSSFASAAENPSLFRVYLTSRLLSVFLRVLFFSAFKSPLLVFRSWEVLFLSRRLSRRSFVFSALVLLADASLLLDYRWQDCCWSPSPVVFVRLPGNVLVPIWSCLSSFLVHLFSGGPSGRSTGVSSPLLLCSFPVFLFFRWLFRTSSFLGIRLRHTRPCVMRNEFPFSFRFSCTGIFFIELGFLSFSEGFLCSFFFCP